MPTIFTLRVNGTAHSVSTPPNTPLLYVLRNDLRLNGAKFGCGQAQCGACSVLVDGIERRSCVYPVSIASQGRITTIEGLGTAHQPSVLQRAFIREQACQCGYCSSGMIMAAQALFERNPKPSICGKPSMRCSYFTMRSAKLRSIRLPMEEPYPAPRRPSCSGRRASSCSVPTRRAAS